MEEAWHEVDVLTEGLRAGQGQALEATRDLALVVLEEAMSKEHTIFTWHELQRRIERLGEAR